MKTTLALLRISMTMAAFATLVVFSSGADSKKAPPKPADLQVIVDVPPTWRPFLDDDIAEALFYRLHEVFRLRGYKGEVQQITTTDVVAKDTPLLRLNLTEWRVDRIGNAQCTMTASLTTAAGEKNLGLASGTALLWPQGGRWSFSRQIETADALDDAAKDAMRDIYNAVARTGLVAGIEQKK